MKISSASIVVINTCAERFCDPKNSVKPIVMIAPTISTLVQERYGFAPLFVATTVCYGLTVLANYWLFVRNRTAVV